MSRKEVKHMTQTVLNNTTNAVFIPTIIAQKALGRFASYMNLAKTVARDFDYSPVKQGTTLNIPKRGTVSANLKAAGDNTVRQAPTGTTTPVTLDQHWEATIAIDDVTEVVQNQRTQDGYAEDMAIALAEKVEAKLAALHTSITNTITYDATSAVTQENSLLKARERLVLNKVPKTERLFGYFHPTVYTRLLQIDRFTRNDAFGPNRSIENAALVRAGGIDIFESQMVEPTGSPVAYHNFVYARDAFILAARPLPYVPPGMGAITSVVSDPDIDMGLRATMHYDGDSQAMVLTLDVLFGVALLDDRRVVEVEST